MRTTRQFSMLVLLVTIGLLLGACAKQPEPATNTPTANSIPSSARTTNPTFSGAVDRRDCEAVAGWVVSNTNSATELKVELYVDNKLAETVGAQNLRPDLVSAGSNGKHGFTFTLPAAYKDGKPHTANVKVAGSNYTVPFVREVFPSFECK